MAIGSRCSTLGASLVLALVACPPATAQPFGHERRIVPTYVTTAPAYGDLELDGEVLAYGVREEIDTFPFAEGAVFLFGRDQGGPNTWGLLKKLASPVPTQGEGFGAAVELQGDELVVVSCSFCSAGVFRVFERDAGGVDNWGPVREVTESDASSCEFGRSMDLEGDLLVVGSHCGGGNRGAVFVYERDLGGAGNWGRRQILQPSDVQPGDLFGQAVALSGTLLAVGAPGRQSGRGALYLFRRDPASGLWIEWRTLTDATTASSQLGQQVALDGSTLLGSRGGDNRISVYRCWQGGPGNWGYLGDLLPPTGNFAVTTYGESLAIDGAIAVVGGSASYFVYDLYDWSAIGVELQSLPASNGGDHWLQFVALDGERTAAAGLLLANSSTYLIDVFTAPTADLAVAVDDGQTHAPPSTTLTYEIVFSNAGAQSVTGAAFDVDLTSASLDLDGVSWTCATSAGAGAGTTCPLAAGDWNDLDDGGLTLGIEPGDTVTISLDAPVLPDPTDPPVECRGRVRTPAAQAVDPNSTDNGAGDRDGLGGPSIFSSDFEAGDLLAWWGETGCP